MIGDLKDKAVLVCGCGNILFGDDGFGPEVAKRLVENYDLPPEVLVLDVGTGIREILFDLAVNEQRPLRLIIVDAVEHQGRQPGEVFDIAVDDIAPQKTADFSLHQFPTVNILKELQDLTSMEVHILVAQVEDIPEAVRPGLSAPVQAAVEVAGQRLAALLGGVRKV